MKIKEQHLLAGIAAAFVLFSSGFFLGRNLIRPAVVTGHTAPTIQALPAASEPAFPLNINTATAGELVFLPGIGEKTAQAIVEWRAEHGPFQEPEELLNVDGIGPSKLSDILPYIETGG